MISKFERKLEEIDRERQPVDSSAKIVVAFEEYFRGLDEDDRRAGIPVLEKWIVDDADGNEFIATSLARDLRLTELAPAIRRRLEVIELASREDPPRDLSPFEKNFAAVNRLRRLLEELEDDAIAADRWALRDACSAVPNPNRLFASVSEISSSPDFIAAVEPYIQQLRTYGRSITRPASTMVGGNSPDRDQFVSDERLKGNLQELAASDDRSIAEAGEMLLAAYMAIEHLARTAHNSKCL